MKAKQRIDKSEPYFVHIGYTFACELKKCKRYGKGRNRYTFKMRECVKKRLDKLNKYWGLAVK